MGGSLLAQENRSVSHGILREAAVTALQMGYPAPRKSRMSLSDQAGAAVTNDNRTSVAASKPGKRNSRAETLASDWSSRPATALARIVHPRCGIPCGTTVCTMDASSASYPA